MFKKFFSSPKKDMQLLNQVTQFLEQYQQSPFSFGLDAAMKEWQVKRDGDSICLCFTAYFACQKGIEQLATAVVEKFEIDVDVELDYHIEPVRQHGVKGVKNIIAIASGKGGVGKSTTTVNLAYALAEQGANVAILDADIYGPSIPTMLGIEGARPVSLDGKSMQPIFVNGLTAMSIGFLVSDKDATIWRGPMASSAFAQMLNETQWQTEQGDDIDYLLIDMPPGTGDIQLTLAQKVPVAGAVVVTTPQDIALKDAVKGIAMFDKVQVPVLGVIENMSYHVCEHCQHPSPLFGEGGAMRLAEQYDIEVLGQLPLHIAIREHSDQGENVITENTASEVSENYRKIAINMAAGLFYQLDAKSPQTPTITTIAE
ncbi:iron-sulfur cluster carrier protein ApbC [Thalassotalea ponticola]|uniref:iron-sulfur cluster carrier protein ApbC n=1 Tax=Thalassotalea ponticola TaxID=1523392 RepID=UPI0025B45B8C|nr:iron-sulfur cluster carrier protein ApbC [Thalassotalea ponticola]MDN3652234.1 iron-sulfur cluster carrier protein ApbC [Thalassotalea ponticola]